MNTSVQLVLRLSDMDFSINSGRVQRSMEDVSGALRLDSTYKTEWWYAWPLESNPENKSRWLLSVDENSSQDVIEAEIEYWMNQVKVYSPPEIHKKSIMAAIKWMTLLLSE